MGVNTLIESAIKELGYTFILDCMKILGYKGTQKAFITEVMKRLNKMFPGTEPWWRRVQFDLKISGGKIETPDGWVRIFHGDTDSHKMLREAVAHQPQHLTVVGINRTFCNVYYKHRDKMRLKGQVHDSIIVQCKDENVDECVKILYGELHQPIVIHSREMWLPVEISIGKDWSNMKEVSV